MNPLDEVLQKQIARQGVISFEKFMELALYCPNLGYYERPTASIGRSGDFITSVSIGSVFGELLAAQFAAWLDATPGPVQLVEAGAHDGRLAGDILGWFRNHRPIVFERLELWLLEPSPTRRAWQQATLKEFAPRVRWFSGWSEVPHRVRGVIYSNELLDAFPVRRFGWDARRCAWFEWGVARADGAYAWARINPADAPDIPTLLAEHGYPLTPGLLAVLPEEFTLECSPPALAWWHAATTALAHGKLCALDYGGEATDLLRPERPRGTVRAYAGHRVSDDVLARPGEADLTAHVNFTALRSAGAVAGLNEEIFSTQEQFLTHIVLNATLVDTPLEMWTAAQRRQFQSLTHPAHLGGPFRVLVQSR